MAGLNQFRSQFRWHSGPIRGWGGKGCRPCQAWDLGALQVDKESRKCDQHQQVAWCGRHRSGVGFPHATQPDFAGDQIATVASPVAAHAPRKHEAKFEGVVHISRQGLPVELMVMESLDWTAFRKRQIDPDGIADRIRWAKHERKIPITGELVQAFDFAARVPSE